MISFKEITTFIFNDKINFWKKIFYTLFLILILFIINHSTWFITNYRVSNQVEIVSNIEKIKHDYKLSKRNLDKLNIIEQKILSQWEENIIMYIWNNIFNNYLNKDTSNNTNWIFPNIIFYILHFISINFIWILFFLWTLISKKDKKEDKINTLIGITVIIVIWYMLFWLLWLSLKWNVIWNIIFMIMLFWAILISMRKK